MQYLLGCSPYTVNVVDVHRFLLSSINGPQYNLRIFPSLTRYWYLCSSCCCSVI